MSALSHLIGIARAPGQARPSRRSVRSAWRCAMALLPIAVVMGAIAGCAPAPPVPTSNIGTITGYYLQYAGRHANASPPNADAFRRYIASLGVVDVDGAFVSSRDGQPYVIRYGIDLTGSPTLASLPPSDQPKIVILHEAEGMGGKKMIATHMGLTFEAAEPDSIR